MTLNALLTGRLHGKPELRTGKSGRPFTTAKLRTAGGDNVAALFFRQDRDAWRVAWPLEVAPGRAVPWRLGRLHLDRRRLDRSLGRGAREVQGIECKRRAPAQTEELFP